MCNRKFSPPWLGWTLPPCDSVALLDLCHHPCWVRGVTISVRGFLITPPPSYSGKNASRKPERGLCEDDGGRQAGCAWFPQKQALVEKTWGYQWGSWGTNFYSIKYLEKRPQEVIVHPWNYWTGLSRQEKKDQMFGGILGSLLKQYKK